MKVKVIRIIVNGVPHRLVKVDDIVYDQMDDVCEYCSLRKECEHETDMLGEHEARYLCDLSGKEHSLKTIFVIDMDLDKTIRNLLDESIEA